MKKGEKTLKTKNNQMLAISFLLIITLSSTIAILPNANAHTPPWTIATYPILSASPNPVGVGQTVSIVMGIDKAFPSAAVNNDDRPRNYKLTITAPDGTVETQDWPYISDTTSAQAYLYTPTQTGTYTLKFDYPGQVSAYADAYQNDTYLPCSKEINFTVQTEPVPAIPGYPLPTSYWTRPIEGQNSAWATIASNWLMTPPSAGLNDFKPDGTAPDTSHIMWAKPLEFGGIVGGINTGENGSSYYNGMSYEGRFGSPIIIQGRLYYSAPLGNNAKGGGYFCVDLQTGEQIWKQTYPVDPTFGQLYWYDTQNQHGVIPSGILWAVSGTTWIAYDAFTGNWLFNETNVPSGTNVYGSDGEILRYVIGGNGAWVACWNNTAAVDLDQAASGPNSGRWRPVGKIVDTSKAYSWNVTLSTPLPSSAAISYANANDILLASVGVTSSTTALGTKDPYTIVAISLKDESVGQILWRKDYPAPSGNITRQLNGMGTFAMVDLQTRVFIMLDKETSGFTGWSLDNGNQLWGPVTLSGSFDYYSATTNNYDAGSHVAAYGNLYACGYSGILYSIDTSTGKIKWTYGNGGEGNSTNSGLETPWGNYPLYISNIADGKVYLFSSEHSPNSPLYKGALLRCVDADSGAELWTISSWLSSGSFYSQGAALADGYMTYFNTYDGQIYTIGKGPSAMTVNAPSVGVTTATPITITGTILDTAAGTQQEAQKANYPYGVPCVSDESMSTFMEALYMQKPLPSNLTGVPITINVVDSNGNYRAIGTTTSDVSGTFAYNWTPDIPGAYTLVAIFEGSNAYYGSNAEAHFYASEPAAAPTPQPTQAPSVADLYFLPMSIAIIIAIIIVGIVIVVVLRKRP